MKEIADMHKRNPQMAMALLNKAALKLIGGPEQGITPLDRTSSRPGTSLSSWRRG